MPDLALVSPIVSALVTLPLIVWMLRWRDRLPLDVPNPRSLHSHAVPRSGGIAMMTGIFAGFALMQTPLVIVLPLAVLVAFSHLDDISGLPIPVRFAVQLAATVAFAYGALPALGFPVLGLFVLGALWMTNLYNFMDGADGLAGGMTVLGFSFLGAGAWMSGDVALLADCAIVAAAAAAFLLVNFPPARLFMGDAGSIPIGFLAAALSLSGWRDGDWPLWFPGAVFAPFIVDATLTMARRLISGERIWDAHNRHYYQRLVRMGWGHRKTALAEYGLMSSCGTVALWALREPAYLQACAIVALLGLHAVLALLVDIAWQRRSVPR
jgi:UDP-N-acetylmuramyl pentapeptide phosphotransferase/UDP-N-acetylglucosamine-1-phosphate transferase